MKKILLLFSLLIFLISCQNDEENFSGIIDEELRPYIEDFISEAALRGKSLDINNVQATLVDEFTLTNDQNFCGYAAWNGNNTGQIEIKMTESCWLARTEIERENLMFHELGHAMLERSHLSTQFPNRYPKSIMCSFQDGISCSNFNTYYENEVFRSYYLDELFNQGVDSPDFASRNNLVRNVYSENEDQEALTDWELFTYIDGKLVDNDPSLYTIVKESATSLTISQNSVINDGLASVVRRFELSSFQACSNLKATSDISVTDLENGVFTKGLSLRERLPDGTLNRFHIFRISETSSGIYEDYTHELYCISKNSDVITISFNLSSQTPTTMRIDNLNIDLLD